MTIAEMKANHEKVSAQFDEVKALIQQIEAHARKNKAQTEIERLNDLKSKKQSIEKRWQKLLKTTGEAALALKVKADIEADLAKLKSSLQEVSAGLQTEAPTS